MTLQHKCADFNANPWLSKFDVRVKRAVYCKYHRENVNNYEKPK